MRWKANLLLPWWRSLFSWDGALAIGQRACVMDSGLHVPNCTPTLLSIAPSVERPDACLLTGKARNLFDAISRAMERMVGGNCAHGVVLAECPCADPFISLLETRSASQPSEMGAPMLLRQ